MKPLFVMLVGLPGSGKSTYRNRADYGTFTHISTDDIVEKEAERLGLSYDAVWPNHIDAASKQAIEAYQAAVRLGMSIIWDQTNLTIKKRRGVISQLPKGYLKIVVHFEVSEELRQQRLIKRVGKTVPAHIDESMRKSYTRPTKGEGFDYVIDGTLDENGMTVAA